MLSSPEGGFSNSLGVGCCVGDARLSEMGVGGKYMHNGVQGIFYGSGSLLLLTSPQQLCLMSSVDLDFLPFSLCRGFLLPSP